MANNIHVKDATSTVLSEGTGLTPATFGPLNASISEVSVATKFSIYCDTGFITSQPAVITAVGTSLARFTFCLTQAGTFSNTITIPTGITTTAVDFWVKASSVDTENPSNDISVDYSIVTTVAAV